MSEYVRIEYHGAELEVHDWLVPLLPTEEDLPLHRWPTFCGAGDGLGNWMVPDFIKGVNNAPPCLIHDIDFGLGKKDFILFLQANVRFVSNSRNLTLGNLHPDRSSWYAKLRCNIYGFAVATLGWWAYEPIDLPWDKNPIVQDKLRRLARAKLGLNS